MTAPLVLPAGVIITLLPPEHQFAPAVLVTQPGLPTDPAQLLRSDVVSTVLTHDPGVNWPDPAGVALTEAALQGGGFALLAFARKRDAQACHDGLCRAVA